MAVKAITVAAATMLHRRIFPKIPKSSNFLSVTL